MTANRAAQCEYLLFNKRAAARFGAVVRYVDDFLLAPQCDLLNHERSVINPTEIATHHDA